MEGMVEVWLFYGLIGVVIFATWLAAMGGDE